MRKNTNILIVEDEAIVALHLKKCLANMGYNVLDTVDSGEKALGLLQNLSPDLILMDIILDGEMDGVSLANQIKDSYGTPVIYLTAYSDMNTLSKAKKTTPYGFLTKPFKENDLESAIEIALYKSSEDAKVNKEINWISTIYNSFYCPLIALDASLNIHLATKSMRIFCKIPPNDLLGLPIRNCPLKILSTKHEKLDIPFEDVLTFGNHINVGPILIEGMDNHPAHLFLAPIRNRGSINGVLLVFNDSSKVETKTVGGSDWESRMEEISRVFLDEGENITVCPYCKKGLDPISKTWQEIEIFVRGRKVNTSSHSVCPACIKKLGFDLKDLRNDSMH